MTRVLMLLSVLLAALAGPLRAQDAPRVLVLGDSMLATGAEGTSVGDRLGAALSARPVDRAVPGARMIWRLPITGAAFSIPRQYVEGEWDWVVVNGGGNDLWMGCGCDRCGRTLDRMISADGRAGAIPRLAMRACGAGARVIWVGYLRTPGVPSPIDHCRRDGDELEGRIARMAGLVDGIEFVSLADLVPEGDRSYHGWDRIHPSPKGSAAIAARIAARIAAAR